MPKVQQVNTDELTLLRSEIHEVKSDVGWIRMSQRQTESQVKVITTKIRDVESQIKKSEKAVAKRFDQHDKKFEAWKSQLFNKIDKFLGRIKKQDEEIAAIAYRKEDHETRLQTIESKLGVSTP